ncbi:MAG: carbamoyltransferase N-terminal domain-containing protein [Anaerolineae bacterium]
MNILGVSCYYHDAAAALLMDGNLVAAAEEERFTRKKHDSSYPKNAISFVQSMRGLRRADLDYVVFYENRWSNLNVSCKPPWAPFPNRGGSGESMVTWFDEKLWIKSKLHTELNVPASKILFVEHHLSHAASAMFCAPFADAAVVTIDGVGEWTTSTIGKATAQWNGEGKNHIELTRELRFPHSLGLLYSAFTAYLGFRVNNGEYKVMGMASRRAKIPG